MDSLKKGDKDLLALLQAEAIKNVSGITLECTVNFHNPVPYTYRFISKVRLGSWEDTPEQALVAYYSKNLYDEQG